jgi:hypothetical protein
MVLVAGAAPELGRMGEDDEPLPTQHLASELAARAAEALARCRASVKVTVA